MSIVDQLERCQKCEAPVAVFATTCGACGTDLFEAKVSLFGELRDGGGMTEDAFEAAIETLRTGPAKVRDFPHGGERKQIADLRLADLARCHVWEFALDEEGEPGQDEETVKPRPDVDTLDPSAGLFVVAARFTAADGGGFAGYVTPGEPGAGVEAPTALTDTGDHVPFWLGMRKPNRAELDRAYRTLGREASDLFPLRVEALVPTKDGTLVHQIHGFGFFDKSLEIRVIV
jgi:hypothetical protein